MSGPLAGIRVIEVGHMLMGPYCGMLLADLGAEVVKVEPGPAGDIGRSISPHAIGSHNAYFASLNRNKKSVVIDLACESGREAFGELVATARALGLTCVFVRRPHSRRGPADVTVADLAELAAIASRG